VTTPVSANVAAPSGRVRHAVVAVFTQMIVSVVYSWSVFRGPLTQLYGWSKAQTIAPYRYALLMVAVGAIVGGLWQDRKGARIVASVGGLLVAIGFLLSAWIGNTVGGMILGYGLIAGLGGGFAYVTPIANLVKWFPDKRGMMVGLAVMGSGVSPLFWSPLIERFIGTDPTRFHETIPRSLVIMAVIFSVLVIGAAQLYRVPPPGWRPAGWNPPVGTKMSREISSTRMLTTWQFYMLWIMFFLGSAVGLTAIGQASPLLQEIGLAGAPISAGVAVGVMGVFNGAGRLSWGSISDRLGRKLTMLAMCATSIVACLGFLRSASGFWMAIAGLCMAAFAYGGFLALMPALTADYYGQRNVGGNYGILFSAWGLCGFLVPGYFEGLLDQARAGGNLAAGYQQVYLQLAILAALVVGMTLFLRAPASEA
jgi:OFA family oxalate/formate antiporter-like MFS transporter